DLSLRAVFEAPTVRGLSERIEAARRQWDGTTPPPLVARVSRAPARGSAHELQTAAARSLRAMSFGQERLWFLEQLAPGRASYIVPAAVRVEGLIDVMALEKSLGELVRRHEVLRTTFVETDGRPVAVVHADLPPTLERARVPAAFCENQPGW